MPLAVIAIPVTLFVQGSWSFSAIVIASVTTFASLGAVIFAHPYQGVVISYHSVPLVTVAGELWGTLSHFDIVPQLLSDSEFELLQRSAELLQRFLTEG